MSWLPKGFEFLSGFPEDIRRKRLVLTLQAIFDDSGSPGQDVIMAMAGLLGPAEVIASVADEWSKCLGAPEPGRIGYFKLAEAVALSGEFNFWQEHKRDAKILQMANVINRDDLFEIGVVIDSVAYKRVFGPWEAGAPSPNRLIKHPYMMLCLHVLARSVTEAVNRGETRPLEIVYDEHKKFRPMFAEVYQYLLENEDRPERRTVMPFQPWFRDDKDFVMIQAADLLAGELRLMGTDNKPSLLKESLCPKLMASGDIHVFGESELRNFYIGMKADRAQD